MIMLKSSNSKQWIPGDTYDVSGQVSSNVPPSFKTIMDTELASMNKEK